MSDLSQALLDKITKSKGNIIIINNGLLGSRRVKRKRKKMKLGTRMGNGRGLFSKTVLPSPS